MIAIRKIITSRPSEILRPALRRFALIPHLIFGLLAGLGPFVDDSSYSSPAFDTIFSWIPAAGWGVLFLTSATMAMYTLITASWRGYWITNVLTMGLSVTWLVALGFARVVDDIDVSLTAFGLWGFLVTTCIIIAATPTPVIKTR